MKKNAKVYFLDILNSVESVGRYVNGMSFEEFVDDPVIQDAVCMRLAVIGEAVNKLPEEEKLKKPEIPWGKIVGMRNFLTHDYGSVVWERVWQTIKEDLPRLKKETEEILKNLD